MASGSSEQQAGLLRERAARIRKASPDIIPENIEASFGLFAAAHAENGYLAPAVTRDIRYGPDSRHRLDVHSADSPGGGAPVLVYVHGGGFTSGDKHEDGSPYYDHIGAWAVRNGMTGVTITYRLAPRHQWPAGAQDVGSALAWVTANIARHGGDPAQVVLAGHSAGAAHVAGYLAGHAGPPAGVAAAVLLSGIYQLTPEPEEMKEAYFGTDASQYPARSALAGLVASGIPLMVTAAQLDPPPFHEQAAALVAAIVRRDGTLPPFAYATDHNHITEIAALGIDDEPVGIPLLRFIESVTGTPLPRP
jgi:acetyl esterase/lipase